jgi:DHA1 family tetracycline resistance protein-like MFS transporter
MAPRNDHVNVDSSVVMGEQEEEESRSDRDRLLHGVDDESGDASSSATAFLLHFFQTPGPPQIIALCLSIALALGSTIGVVPAVVEDRYARLYHNYTGESCLSLPTENRPTECSLGNEDAQNSAALASFVSNVLTFGTSSFMGSISDEKGRRGIMLLGIGLSLLAPLCLVLMQLIETMDPLFYYTSHAISGLVSWFAISLSSLSDVMPPMWRAPSFGLISAGFSLGFALSPMLAVYMSHLEVSIFALGILVSGFLFACISLPETLSSDASNKARVKRLEELPTMDTHDIWKYNLLQPGKALMILNRNKLFRLLSALAFFSGCVSTADHTLFLYYAEENFGFNDKDVAKLFLIIGGMGILVQTIVLKPMTSWIGERRVIMVAFLVGALHNFLYGIAKGKTTLFVSATIASFTGMSFPTISAIKANNCSEIEQGRIQGALYSLSSLASAIGPMMLRYVSNKQRMGAALVKDPCLSLDRCCIW